MSTDWACDSCTFINSGLLMTCELCNVPRSGQGPGPGPSQAQAQHEPIVLSDDDDELVDSGKYGKTTKGANHGNGPGGAQGAANTSKVNAGQGPAAKQQVHDVVSLLDDDNEGPSKACSGVVDLTDTNPVRPRGKRSQKPQQLQRENAGPSGSGKPHAAEGAANQVYNLDTCSCIVELNTLAAQLRPAVAVASAAAAAIAAKATEAASQQQIQPAPPPAQGRSMGRCRPATTGAGAAAHAFPAVAGQPTLLDLAAPLICPSAGCRHWLSSRDVRLLLGPYGTRVLFFSTCMALRREAKAAKTAQREHLEAGAASAGRGGAAGGKARGSGGGRKGGSRGAGEVSAGDSGAGGGRSDASEVPERLPLQSLTPSCPECHVAMMAVSALGDAQRQPPQAPAPQQPEQRQRSPAIDLSDTPRRSQRQRRPPPKPHQQPDTAQQGGSSAQPQTGAAAPRPKDPGQGPLGVTQLRAALQVRGRGAPGGPEAGHLQSLLREAVGPRCAFLCLGCDHNVDEGVVLPADKLQELQSQADTAAHALRLLRRVRAVLLGADEEEDGDGEEDDAEAGAGAAAAGGSAAGSGGGGRRGRGKKRGRGDTGGGGQAWAKGVGYGGQGGRDPAAIKAAQERQRKADDEVRACLTALLDIMTFSSSCRTTGAQRAAGEGGDAALACPPPVMLAALQYGGLPYVLRVLLQNDSLLDMGQRQKLYDVVLSIVRRCISSMALLELLVVPAADPRDAAAPTASPGSGGGTGTGEGSGGAGGSDPPLCSVFESLARQCSIFKRSAQELADGAEDDIAALGLALELGALAEEVAAGVRMWRDNMGGAAGILSSHLQLPAGDQNGAGGGAAGGDAASELPQAKRRNLDGAAGGDGSGGAGAGAGGASGSSAGGAAAAGGAAGDAAARRSEYLSRMRPLQFREVALMGDHHFRREAGGAGSGAGGEQMRTRLKRITGEISGLATGLPLDWEAAAFVAVDDNRVDVLRALLIPASDTPYANGPFIFDIYLPPNYPNVPPQVQFLTTGGGRVRFNPNLYAEGKVCLSLLGTWSGPSWDPGMSTILQVLVSIQSMILVSDPYYNEPGWERQASSAEGRKAAANYSHTQRYNTLAFSILPALQMLAAAPGSSSTLAGGSTFRDVLQQHFRLKGPEVLRQVDEWQAGITAAASDAAVNPRGGPSHGFSFTSSQMGDVRKHTDTVVPQIKSLLQRVIR